MVNRQHHLLRCDMKLVGGRVDDSLVGLVRHEPVDAFGIVAGRLEGIDDHVGDHADGVLEDLAALHAQMTHGLGRGRPAVDEQLGLVAAVGAQMRGYHAAVGGGLARLLLRLQNHRARAIAEQHAGAAIIPVEDARESLGADHQRALEGAGAVVLEAQEQPGKAATDRGVVTTHLRSDGRHKAKLFVDGGPSSTQTVGHLRMEGREVFKHAVGMITDVIVDAFEATGHNAESIDWFVPHQANKRIIDASAHKLHIAPQKVVLTVDRHGNTSAASIPLALSVARKDGRIKRGDLVLLEAMGGGFTWGSALVRW